MPAATSITTTMTTTITTKMGTTTEMGSTEGNVGTLGIFRLLSWLSPAFPTGAFAYSHGLEWAVETHDVSDEASLRLWLADVLAHGSGRTDAILLRHAHRAAGDATALATVAELAVALAPSAERRMEATGQGNAFVLAAAPWMRGALSALDGPVAYPVAVGALAGAHGLDEDAACTGLLQAFTANLISAAVRLVPLGQSAGLRVLAALEPEIIRVADATKGASLDDIGGFCFRSDIAAMRHETQYTRLFRS